MEKRTALIIACSVLVLSIAIGYYIASKSAAWNAYLPPIDDILLSALIIIVLVIAASYCVIRHEHALSQFSGIRAASRPGRGSTRRPKRSA